MAVPALPAPSGSAADLTSMIDTAIEQIREGYETAVEKFNEVVGKVRDWWWAIGPGLLWLIHRALEDLRAGLDRLAEFIRVALERHTPVVSLIIASFGWTTDVKSGVSNLSSRAIDPARENLAYWTGPAATRYKDKSMQQKRAIDESTDRAEFIAGWLFAIAQSNVEFAASLADILAKVAAKFVDLAVEAGTVVGLVLTPNTAGDIAAMLTEGALQALIDIGERLITTLGNVRDLWGVVVDNTWLPNGTWPEAVAG